MVGRNHAVIDNSREFGNNRRVNRNISGRYIRQYIRRSQLNHIDGLETRQYVHIAIAESTIIATIKH